MNRVVIMTATLIAACVTALPAHATAPTKLRGTVDLALGATASGKPVEKWQLSRAGQRSRDLLFSGQARPRPGQRVTVIGRKTAAGKLKVKSFSAVKTRRATTAAAVPTGHKAAVIIVSFPGSANPVSDADARAKVFTNADAVAARFRESTHGAVTLTGDVFRVTVAATTGSSCDFGGVGLRSLDALRARGISIDNYRHHMFLPPPAEMCPYKWLAYVDDQRSFFFNAVFRGEDALWSVGFNKGAPDSRSQRCVSASGQPVTLSAADGSGSCSWPVHSDVFSQQGATGNLARMTSFDLMRIGALPSTSAVTVTRGQNASVTLQAHDLGLAGARTLRIPRSNQTDSFYDFEVRRNPGTGLTDRFAADQPVQLGVLARITPGLANHYTRSLLLDSRPGTSTLADAPYVAGDVFTDSYNGVKVSVVSVSSTGATVDVIWTTDTTPPSAPTGLTAAVGTDGKVGLRWSASSDASGIYAYRVYRNGSPVTYVTATSTSWTDPTLPTGSVAYSVTAVDASSAQNESAHSNVVTVGGSGADTTAPTVKISAPVSSGSFTVSGSSVTIQAAASDNKSVTKMTMLLDGKAVTSTTGAAISYKLATRKLSAGTHQLVVSATDAAGNTGSASIQLIK